MGKDARNRQPKVTAKRVAATRASAAKPTAAKPVTAKSAAAKPKVSKPAAKPEARRTRQGPPVSAAPQGNGKPAIRRGQIHACYVSEKLFDDGLGYVIISRRTESGMLTIGIFLMDVFCLGVKDAFLQTKSTYEFDQLTERLSHTSPLSLADPSYARKLLDGAVAYARSLGFEPHRDYDKTAVVFADIDPDLCAESFVFGKDGKPFFVSGPQDSEQRVSFVLNTLTQKLGAEGFHYTISAEEEGEEEADFEEEESLDEGAESDEDFEEEADVGFGKREDYDEEEDPFR